MGELKVLTRNSPGIYYEGPFGPTGFEYDLLKRFSDSLGVKLSIEIAPNAKELLNKLSHRNAHFAAAKLTVTSDRKQLYLFTHPYHEITHQLVYRHGTKRPRELKEIENLVIEISANDSLVADLKKLKKTLPKMNWRINHEASAEDLMLHVYDKLIDFTIISSDEIMINQQFYPELRIAFDINKIQKIAWAFAQTDDTSLYNAANKFLEKQQQSGELQLLIEHHFGHLQTFDYVENKVYQRHIESRLPNYQPYFEKAGKDNEIEWILLAAMSYQESHWNEKAKSPTGVRGLMMITLATAKYLGLNNRVEPHQSIFGGAYYFAKLKKKFPPEVKEPNRTLFALASYNLGYGHVRDAMKLTKKSGKDETKWLNLKETLPLLRKKKWYKKTRFGYARGDEAVKYVENIRSYYDILKWEASHIWRTNTQKYNLKALDISPSAL